MPNGDYNYREIVYEISRFSKKRLEIFRQLPIEKKRDIILRLGKRVQFSIVTALTKEELVSVLEHMDTDEATDILRILPAKKRDPIVAEINEQIKADVSLLLQFDSETAAGLMSVDYIQVEAEDSITSVAKQVKVHEDRTGRLPAILVMDSGRLLGFLPGHALGLSRTREKAIKFVKKIITVNYKSKTNDVLEIFRQHPHSKIVVLGNTNNVMGIIYSDDMLKIIKEKEMSSLYDFAGVSQEESVYDSAKTKIKYRYKWLIINLGTSFLAAFAVGLFDETISKYVLLAVYMPIVAGMGGNAATQTLAVLVRGISLKQIELKTVWRTLNSELGAGLVNGLLNGIIVATVVAIKDKDLKIGIILAIAMIVNLFVAAFFGTVIPLIMKKLGKDPASSATIFITTATDVLGFVVFLGLATLILG
jgi:magnesium transporter